MLSIDLFMRRFIHFFLFSFLLFFHKSKQYDKCLRIWYIIYSFFLSSLILYISSNIKSPTSYDGVFSIVKNRSNFLWGHRRQINQSRLYQHYSAMGMTSAPLCSGWLNIKMSLLFYSDLSTKVLIVPKRLITLNKEDSRTLRSELELL